MRELVTIIIPVYNVEKYIRRCIESVLNQDYNHLEIILVDDGSTDSSGEICDEYAKKDNRIQVIHKQNEGLGPARNSALDIAQGEYVHFIDSDDYIFPGIIKKLHETCEKSQVDNACCGYKSGKKVYYCEGEKEVFDSVTATKNMLMCEGIDANACCKLYKRKLFEGVRYPACAYEVVPVTYKVFLKANRVANIKEYGYYIEKRQGSITRSSFGKNNLLYLTLAKDMIADLKIHCPELNMAAEVFYLNALITMTEKSREDEDAVGKNEYRIINEEFYKEYHKIMHHPNISHRKKLISIFIKLKIYTLVKKIYNKIG